jgi:hypothetical protein
MSYLLKGDRKEDPLVLLSAKPDHDSEVNESYLDGVICGLKELKFVGRTKSNRTTDQGMSDTRILYAMCWYSAHGLLHVFKKIQSLTDFEGTNYPSSHVYQRMKVGLGPIFELVLAYLKYLGGKPPIGDPCKWLIPIADFCKHSFAVERKLERKKTIRILPSKPSKSILLPKSEQIIWDRAFSLFISALPTEGQWGEALVSGELRSLIKECSDHYSRVITFNQMFAARTTIYLNHLRMMHRDPKIHKSDVSRYTNLKQCINEYNLTASELEHVFFKLQSALGYKPNQVELKELAPTLSGLITSLLTQVLPSEEKGGSDEKVLDSWEDEVDDVLTVMRKYNHICESPQNLPKQTITFIGKNKKVTSQLNKKLGRDGEEARLSTTEQVFIDEVRRLLEQ